MKPNIASLLAGGGDNCPGAAVPPGPYSVAAPFNDSGNTTGANSTISNIGYYYYYSTPVAGPDLIYSFTLTSRGPAAEIKVTPNSAAFDPVIYIIDSRNGCPVGTGNSIYNYWRYENAAGNGRAEVINTGTMNYLPLNVPLSLVVDAAAADNAGPYTLRIEDVTIASGPRTKFDFDGNTQAEFAVFRPSDGFWYMSRNLENGFTGIKFGLASDRIVPADYDGDGKTDIAIYRDGVWWWIDSSTNSVRAVQFGLAADTPVPADFTGDGRAELAIYRDGAWWTYNLVNGEVASSQFGLAADKPVVADYDGDGRADRAVYRDGIWYIDRSSQGFAAASWGLPTDKVVPADYDGDGKVDPAVYRDGDWWVLGTISGVMYRRYGEANDIPAPADYNGDGWADFAVYHDGIWRAQTSWGEFIKNFGRAGDIPVPSAYNR